MSELRKLQRWIVCLVLVGVVATHAAADENEEDLTPHHVLQAVNGDGSPQFSQASFPIVVEGIVLNRPADMLDATANFLPWAGGANAFRLGAQWQVFIQSDAPGDFGGTALYLAQNYGNFPWVASDSDSYSNTEWLAELERLDPGTTLKPGDRVIVRANIGSPFGGKFNINENHDKDPSADFTIEVVPGGVLPVPAKIELSDVVNAANGFIFDPSRATGAEHYQATLVRLQDVTLVDGAWDSKGMVTVTDGQGRTFEIHKGIDAAFDSAALPTGTFDVIGIFNQEATNNLNGYEIWVMDPRDLQMPGDATGDRFTDGADYTVWADNFLQPNRTWQQGDFTGDGIIDGADYTVWADHYAPALLTAAAVPEPATWALAAGGAVMLLARSWRRKA